MKGEQLYTLLKTSSLPGAGYYGRAAARGGVAAGLGSILAYGMYRLFDKAKTTPRRQIAMPPPPARQSLLNYSKQADWQSGAQAGSGISSGIGNWFSNIGKSISSLGHDYKMGWKNLSQDVSRGWGDFKTGAKDAWNKGVADPAKQVGNTMYDMGSTAVKAPLAIPYYGWKGIQGIGNGISAAGQGIANAGATATGFGAGLLGYGQPQPQQPQQLPPPGFRS